MNNRNVFSSLIAIISVCLSPTCFAQASESCSALASYSLPNSTLEITSSTWAENKTVQAGPFAPPVMLPIHCHIEGFLDKRIGVDDVEYSIGFALNLPQSWNGHFLFQGGGGLNGSIGEPIGAQATGNTSALERGFAVVSTDSGHRGTVFDGSFMQDQEAALNFFSLANARVTVIAKQLLHEFYANEIAKSYFVGCSTGGREGMIMSQRFPYYFDGIIAGAPAMRTGLSNLGDNWVAVQLNKAAEKDSQGLPIPGGTFDKAEQGLIVNAVLNSCDALDGIQDGLIFNPQACDFDPMELVCQSDDSNSCLTAAKATALATAFAGPVDSKGMQVYPGFYFDTGIDDAGFIGGLIVGNNNAPVGPPVDTVLELDIDNLVQAITPDSRQGDSTSVNLSSFKGNGGKLIFYHGLSDPWFSAQDTVGYYQGMASANGGLTAINAWSKLYLVPGMGHCQGGDATLDNFDMLTGLVDWVENDQAPEGITATGLSMPGISRPLCPYPAYPSYTGSNSSDAASNFTCTE